MSTKKKAAAGGTPTAASEKITNSIITFSSDDVKENAVEKLNAEDKAAQFDRCGRVMHAAVRDALCEFSRQNAEFAQAIVQTDKTFGDCLKHVAKGCGSGISDFEAFSRAVDFYFSGAKISFKMLIDVGDGVLCDVTQNAAPEPMELTLDSLMDW